MRLKIFTTACVVAGFVLMGLLPWMFGQRPQGDAATRLALAEWGRTMLVLITFICLAWISAFAGAIFVMRQTKREYLDQTRENLNELIEGTLKDHGRK